jgi:hypothetical protein
MGPAGAAKCAGSTKPSLQTQRALLNAVRLVEFRQHYYSTSAVTAPSRLGKEGVHAMMATCS